MPLRIKNADLVPNLEAPPDEILEVVGIKLPVRSWLPYGLQNRVDDLMARNNQGVGFSTIIAEAFCLLTQELCEPEDHVRYEDLAKLPLTREEARAITAAVLRVTTAARANETPDEANEGEGDSGNEPNEAEDDPAGS